MAEEFAFQHAFRQGPAVDGGHRFTGALAMGMNGACHAFLPGPAGTDDQNRGVRRRHPRDGTVHLQHLRAAAYDRRAGEALGLSFLGNGVAVHTALAAFFKAADKP